VIAALQPLADLPGVRLVMLITHDGVPIAVPGKSAGDGDVDVETGGFGFGKNDAFAAIASGWLGDVERSVAELSWHAPRRAVLRAARGTLVLNKTSSAILLVLLARGLGPEEVRLSMDGTIARIERNLRGMGSRESSPPPERGRGPVATEHRPEPPGALPMRPASLSLTDDVAELTENTNQNEPSGN